jgi:hypothetical protein
VKRIAPALAVALFLAAQAPACPPAAVPVQAPACGTCAPAAALTYAQPRALFAPQRTVTTVTTTVLAQVAAPAADVVPDVQPPACCPATQAAPMAAPMAAYAAPALAFAPSYAAYGTGYGLSVGRSFAFAPSFYHQRSFGVGHHAFVGRQTFAAPVVVGTGDTFSLRRGLFGTRINATGNAAVAAAAQPRPRGLFGR